MLKKVFRFTTLGFLIMFFFVTFFLKDNFSISNIQLHEKFIFNFVDENYLTAVFLFFVISAFFINSPIPFAALLALIGGYLFGFLYGSIFNIIAMILGSIVGYFLASYLFRNFIQKKFRRPISVIQSEMNKYGTSYLITLRFVMAVPYFLIHYFAGVTRIPFWKFIFSTVVGVIPESMIFAYGGSTVREVGDLHDLFQAKIILVIIILVSFSLMPLWIRLFKKVYRVVNL